jgi:hypothetical protein
MNSLKTRPGVEQVGDLLPGAFLPPVSERPGLRGVAREGSDMSPTPPRKDPPRAARAAGVVLQLDDTGRAAAARHAREGRGRVMPTPQGLFDSWATRPRVAK